MKINLPEFTTTNAYGRAIRTSFNVHNDETFLDKLFTSIGIYFKKFTNDKGLDHKSDDAFVDIVDSSLRNTVVLPDSKGSCSIFSESKDHMNHPIRRYIVRDEKQGFNYIVDAFMKLNVRLGISSFKRFLYTHIPSKFVKIDGTDFVPRMEYVLRIWNSPIGYYQRIIAKADIPIEYNNQVEKFRDLVGYPEMYKLDERKIYERADYYIRRAIFGEVFDI